VIRTAIASRDLAGSRDIASVLDARIRQRVGPLLPQPQGAWAARVPPLADPGRRAHLAEIATMMDDRTQRLGQHAAAAAPAWAITALGPVPTDPAERRGWETKAASIAAYREMYGYHHPDDPIGPEPAREAPEQRAAWHEAFAALGPAGGPDVRAMPDGRLWLIRDSYAAETAWAPRHVGKQLRLARLGAATADQGAIRAAAGADAARKAGDHARAERHETLAASYHAMSERYRQQETVFGQTMADRLQWEHATAGFRHLAVAADAELRRRHPGQRIEPLRSAEPAPLTDTEREELPRAPGKEIGEMAGRIRDRAAQRHAFREKIAQRRRLEVPREDPDWGDSGEAFPARSQPRRDAILQPPKPQITPSATILRLAADHDAEPGGAG
jgi:hypothetical protein